MAETRKRESRTVVRLGTLVSAFAFGAAVGFLENAISGWALRLGGKKRGEGPSTAQSWPSLLALQFVLRVLLSLGSLYVTYLVSAGDPITVLSNLAGLLVARYLLLWRLAKQGR